MKERIDENIVLVGTSHVSQESVEEIKSTVEEEQPHLIGVELGKPRFQRVSQELESEDEDEQKPKLTQALFSPIRFTLGSIQSLLSNITKNEAGGDMKTAVELGKKEKHGILLLDRDINETLSRLNSKLGKKQKLKIFSSIIFSLIYLKYKKITGKTKEIEEKITKIENPSSFTEKLASFSPVLAKVLIEERDYYMAKNIQKIREFDTDLKIVAVVGAGHLEGIKNYLENPETMPESIEEV